MNSRHSIQPNGLLSRFVRDQRGISAIIFAIVLPALIGFVGISVEVGQWFAQKRKLQAAADAGAMAGARSLAAGDSWATAQTAASNFAVRNGAVAANVTSNNPPTSGSYTADSTAVEVLITESQTLMISGFFRSSAVTVNARAVATTGSQDLGCVVALEGSASEAVHLSNQARMNLSGCGLTVNSSSSTGTHMENNTQVNADFARLVGNYDLDNSGTFGSTPVTTGQTATANPYASLANPATPATCSSGSGQSGTINPGNYCGLNIGNNTNLTLTAGTYYIKDGTFSMGANSRLYANAGVTIILTGSAYMNLNSNAYIQITAPTSGAYEGIAIMQDPDGTAATHTMSANVYIGLQGAIYFPNALLHMDSNSFITTSTVMTSAYATTQPANDSANAGCGLVVADTYHMDGNSRINLNNTSATCDTAQVPTTTTGGTPSLVE